MPSTHCPQGCTKHVITNNYSNIGQNDLISLNQAIPWIFPEFHVCHIMIIFSQNKVHLYTDIKSNLQVLSLYTICFIILTM